MRLQVRGEFEATGFHRNQMGGNAGANLIPIAGDTWRNTTGMWSYINQAPTITITDPPNGAHNLPGGKVHQFVTSSSYAGGYIDHLIPINPEYTYYGKIWAATIAGANTFYAGYIAYDKDLNQLAGNNGTWGYFIAGGVSPPSTGLWYYGTIQGTGTAVTQFPVYTKYIKPLILTNYNAAGTMQVAGFEISDRPFSKHNDVFNIANETQLSDVSTDASLTNFLVLDADNIVKKRTSGADGSSGTSGTSGTSGSSGTSGTRGTSGSSGNNGANGNNGADGSSGTSGTRGTSGSSGNNGGTGPSGADGSSGTSGTRGTSGSSGNNGGTGPSGADGSSGTSGTRGTSGSSGNNGAPGNSGSSGTSGSSGSGSDIRIKQNLRKFSAGISTINQLNTQEWEYNGLADTPKGATAFGIVAQEALDIIPYCIYTKKIKLNPEDKEESEVYQVNPSNLIWVLVNSAQEQQKEIIKIPKLEKRVSLLERKVKELEKKLSK